MRRRVSLVGIVGTCFFLLIAAVSSHSNGNNDVPTIDTSVFASNKPVSADDDSGQPLPPTANPPIRWAGSGKYRVLVEVAAVELAQRSSDEMPADVEVDLTGALQQMGVDATANIASLQVMRIDAATGNPLTYDNYAYARSKFDRPFCWYDGAIPYDFPEVFAPLSYGNGRIKRTISPRAGYMYNVIGEWQEGHLAFVHTQERNESSYYAVYFDILRPNEEPQEVPPRGWLGDGLPRRDRRGESTTGADATKIALDDWNDDGLIDILYGEQYGQLFVMPNVGTASKPMFPYAKMLFDVEGQPLDLGIHAAVLVVDWDRDGAKDLLVGTYRNRVAFIKNVGTNRDRRLVYKGFLEAADGSPLALPTRPVAAKPEGVFKHDYYPVLSAVDWNDDGRLDLLAGGYVTGRIYFYENRAPEPIGLPVLQLRGPLEADGKPINVRDWCAAPCVADFNADGLPDLISGSFTWLPKDKHQPSFFRYYENSGTRAKPLLSERPFPFEGDLKSFRLPVPRAADWDTDGKLDLVVSSGANIFLFQNIGTATSPVFRIHNQFITAAWGNARLPGRRFLDFNGDGLADLTSGYTVRLNSGAGNPYRFDKVVNVLPEGAFIDHPVEKGDGHFWPYLTDFDGDGRIDVLFGDWHGHIWFHANQSSGGQKQFDLEGHRLQMENGAFIKVGPIEGDTEGDFVALQGARTVFAAADYDNDRLNDLVVGDTYGKIRLFRNLGPPADPRFALPLLVGDMKFRLLVDAVDWNEDGRMDVIAGTASHRVSVFLNKGSEGAAAFGAPEAIKLPPIKETRVRVVDLNRDGDRDLFVMSTQGSILVERSFLDHGYARGRVVKTEKQEAN
jgi:hypothetical protein